MTRLELRIGGMTCQGCAQSVQRALAAVPGVDAVELAYPGDRALVRASDGIAPETLIRAVEEAGYTASRETGASAPTAVPARGERSDSSLHLVVIGGGSGAFAAAIRAAELGARVTMVERGTMGGTCVNRGCVPSKTLIRAAEIRHLIRAHPFDGLPRNDGRVDVGPLIAQKRELVERLRTTKYADVLGHYPGIEYMEGEARFTAPLAIDVDSAQGERVQSLTPDRVIVATGARPWVPDLPGLDDLPPERVWTNEQALEADTIPERLFVAGGGPVGVELAQMFARLGSRVTLIAPRLVPGSDSELSRALAGYLQAEGVNVVSGARIHGVAANGDGSEGDGGFEAIAQIDGEDRSFPFDRLLLATGRTANTDALGLDAAGIVTTGRGFIPVDEGLRTGVPHVYAVGDVTDRPQFVYVAAKAGVVAAENALRRDGEGQEEAGDAHLDLTAMPSVIFTNPQLAWVGLTEPEAAALGEDVESRTLAMEHVPRALANRDTRGLIKLVTRRGDRRLLGAHVLSPQAGEVIQTAVLAMKYGLTVDELADTLFPYLTEVEGLKLAAQSFSREVERLSCCAG